MIDRLRIAAHNVIGRMVMPDAPECPECGSRFLVTEREVGLGGHSIKDEKCTTCGASWGIGSEMWNELHPEYDFENGGKRMCRCCGAEFAECDCVMQRITDEDGTYYYCDVHLEIEEEVKAS